MLQLLIHESMNEVVGKKKFEWRKLSYPLWPALFNGNPKLYRSLGWLYSGYISHTHEAVTVTVVWWYLFIYLFFNFFDL